MENPPFLESVPTHESEEAADVTRRAAGGLHWCLVPNEKFLELLLPGHAMHWRKAFMETYTTATFSINETILLCRVAPKRHSEDSTVTTPHANRTFPLSSRMLEEHQLSGSATLVAVHNMRHTQEVDTVM